jgi:hypothetical protein
MPRPEDRERVEPVRTLRPDRMLPLIELPVTALPVIALGGPLRPPPDRAGRDTGGIPQVEQ